MIKSENENILNSVIATFSLSKIKHTYNIMGNKTISIITLNKSSYDNIFKQIGKTKIEPKLQTKLHQWLSFQMAK
jgi:hypothetical protein